MARTIKEISDGMKSNFVQNATLRGVYGWDDYAGTTDEDALNYYNTKLSAVSVESVLIGIVAACVATVENMMDWHKKEIDTAISRERYGHPGWYEKMALKFRYGEDIDANYDADPDPDATSDFSESTVYAENLTDEELEEVQVVKYAYCEDQDDFSGATLKVAGTDSNGFKPLTSAEYASFVAYIHRIKPAGVPVQIISQGAEALTLGLTIYYNPLLMDSEGRLLDNSEPVKDAIKGYLNSIGFNGEFTVQKLVDSIQNAEGVELVGFDNARVNGNEINHRYVPYSGYMSVNFDDCEIKYISNVKVSD